MAEITGFTAARMKEIEDSTIVHGLINDEDNLILYTRDGRKINAGHIKGGTAEWIRDIAPTITEHGDALDLLDERYREIGEELHEVDVRADELAENLTEVVEKTTETVDLVGTIQQTISNNELKAGQAVKDTIVEYALAVDQETAPETGWSTDYPERTEEYPFIWMKTTIERVNGQKLYLDPIPYVATPETGPEGPQGPQGEKGEKGDSGKDGLPGKDGVGLVETEVSYNKSSSATVAPTSGWTSQPPAPIKGQYLWTRTIWTYSDNTSETGYSTAYWAIDGASGDDGIAGKDGVGIQSTSITYAQSTSGTTAPTSGWTSDPPNAAPGSYIWTKTVWTYTDDTTETGYSVGKIGNTGAKGDKGDTGKDGVAGKDGVGLVGTTITYAKSTSATTVPTSGWGNQPPTPTKGQYLWTKTVWNYSDGTNETGYSTAYWATDGATGKDGIAGKDGVGITNTTITYTQSTSGTTAPSSGWTSNPPSATPGSYIWTKTIWTYTDNTTETGYSVGKIGDTGATGAKGDKGDKGDKGNIGEQGVSVEEITTFYKQAKNYAPDITAEGSRVEIARNLFQYPRADAAWNYSSATNRRRNAEDSGTLVDVTNVSSLSYIARGNTTPNEGSVVVEVGKTYWCRWEVTNTGNVPLEGLRVLIMRNTSTSAVSSNTFDLNPGEHYVYEDSYTAIEGDETIRIGIQRNPGPPSGEVGELLIHDGWVISDSPNGSMQCFTGDHSDDPDFTSEWAGEPWASESILYGTRIRNFTTNYGYALISKWEGKPAIRVKPTNSTVTNSRPHCFVPENLHNGGTAYATINIPKSIVGPLHAQPLSHVVWNPTQNSSTAPNEPGSYVLPNAFGPFTNTYAWAFRHGGTLGSGDVWWSDIGLYEGDITTPNETDWSDQAPSYRPGYDVLSSLLVTYSDGRKQWTTVTKEPAYDVAQRAINIANISKEQIEHALDDELPEDPVEGAVWFERNEDGDVVAVWQWNGINWGIHTMVTGLLIVPGSDGKPTIIDENGIDTTDLIADIMKARLIWADEMGTKTLLIQDIPRENLESDVIDTLSSADEIKRRVLIETTGITISKDAGTKILIKAESLDMMANHKVVLSAKSESNLVVVPELVAQSAQVGNHRMEALASNPKITIFRQLS